MNYRPYPNVARALAQLERHRAPDRPTTLMAWVDEHLNLGLTEWQRVFLSSPRTARRTAITKAIVDQAVKAGEHVHVAGPHGMRCAGRDDACPLPGVEPAAPAPARHCPGFPKRCPNLRTVMPEPPTHYGGIRCGCGDDTPTTERMPL